MERFRDFRQRLEDLKDRRVRICFNVVDTEKAYTCYGWIRKLNEHTLEFEADTSTGDAHLMRSHFNLECIVVYAVDEVDPEADLAEEKKAEHIGERTEYIPYDKEGKPVREPQKGYVILHKDHIYAKGTVYTKTPNGGEEVKRDV